MQGTQSPGLERARRAAAEGDWRQAYELLIGVDATAPLTGPDLPLLAGVAYADGHLDVAIETWERAHTWSLEAGERLAAAGAAVRIAMHLLFDTALLAPVRAWLARAERLLDGPPETPVHAWLAVVRNYERLLSGDLDTARHWARRAIDIGAACDPAAAALGRVAEARCLILQGDVTHGLELLNEAAVAAVTGEIDPLSTGVVYCEVVCALQALGQYDLAEQWTEAMERWHAGRPVGSLHGRCRVHRAEILRLRGSCAEAESEALLACEELRPYLRRELGWPLTELGRIRMRKGDIEGAEEAFLAAHHAGWDPQPGLALVHLARGRVALAAASIRDALEHPATVPSKEWPPNTDLRRAPLLEAQVEIAIAAGDLECARTAADELGRIAARFQSGALSACAALAMGHVLLAEGNAHDGSHQLEAAAQQWGDIGAPYETALARMSLGRSLLAGGKLDRGLLELQAARATFERIGAMSQAARAAAASPAGHRQIGAESATASVHSGDANTHRSVNSTFRREGDYWSVSFRGRAASVRDSKGLRYVSRLLGEPGREFHVLDLVALERGPDQDGLDVVIAPSTDGDAGELLDARARAAYRRRLAEIDEDLTEAQAFGDAARMAQAEAERDILMRELSRAVGLGNRSRRAGSAAERARSAVTRAVRHALVRIRTHHADLGDHLDHSIRTGTYCLYSPDPRNPVEWKV